MDTLTRVRDHASGVNFVSSDVYGLTLSLPWRSPTRSMMMSPKEVVKERNLLGRENEWEVHVVHGDTEGRSIYFDRMIHFDHNVGTSQVPPSQY